jgi:asparagine synthase (glutamine-hydrolysing)
MCGISGIIFNKPRVENDKCLYRLEIMKTAQHKRGPDSSAVWSNQSAYLAHNRLSIIDLNTTGDQPMHYGDWVIVFNGEIYNYKELRSSLISKGHSFKGSSDTEVLLHLISEFGVKDALTKLTGMFAMCIYNKSTGDYYLVRDRLGEKPLFYFIDDDKTLFFSSNPASIVRAIPEKKWLLDKEALWEYFLMGGIFSEKTLFTGIKRLDSATLYSSINETVSIEKYWVPKFHKGVTTEQMKNTIRHAITSRTVSDVPIVLFLSGGVDSSASASILKNIDAVHLISPEIDKAQAVANLFKMNFKVVEPKNFDISDTLLEYSMFSGEPTMAGFIPYITSKEVSPHYKVALTANGADELFFGYTRIPTPEIPPLFFDKRLANNHININARSGNEIEQILHIFRHPDSFTIPLLEKQKNMHDLLSLLEDYVTDLSSDFPNSSKYRWLELMTYVKGDLNGTLDFSSMCNSLEVRAPFLDHTLVEMALSLDERQHISYKNGRKHFLKEILHDEKVPSHIWERNKIGFSLIDSYLKSISELKEHAYAQLEQHNFIKINLQSSENSRDLQYLKSAALGFYYWKIAWIDSGLVKII